MALQIHSDEVRLLVKALPWATLEDLLDTELTPELRKIVLSEYDYRNMLNNPNPRHGYHKPSAWA